MVTKEPICRTDLGTQPKDPATPVWRYLTTVKFLSLLISHELHLGRLDLYPDKFEGLHTNALEKSILKNTSATCEQAKKMAESMQRTAREHRPVIFVSCWCLLHHELEAMWQLYCGAGDGVAIVLPYDGLVSSIGLQGTHAGVLRYLDFDRESIRTGEPLEIAMHKRVEYIYENEARIAYYRPDWIRTKTSDEIPTRMQIPWEPEDYIQRIVVSPHAPSSYINMIRDLVDRLAPKLVDRIEDSAMRYEGRGAGGGS